MNNWSDKFVLVLGLGETGLSMVRWLSAQGARLRIADSRSNPPGLAEVGQHAADDQIFCGAFSDALLEDIELIAISPGVPLRDPVVALAVARGIPVVGDIELFAQQLRKQDSGFRIQDAESGIRHSEGARVITITGANGKTTVTSMVQHMCDAAGKDAVAAGNISPAVLDVVLARGANQPEVWVLELSSFQLETTEMLYADAATVLNISEDHLDRYADMNEYRAAKARIFTGCAVQVLNRDDARSMSMANVHGNDKTCHAPFPHPTPPPEGNPHPIPLPEGEGSFALSPYGGKMNRGLGANEALREFRFNAGSRIITFGLNLPESPDDFGIERAGNEIWLMQGDQQLLEVSELKIAGLHNAANALAALALCRALDLPMPVLLEALRSFRGLPHRVERVAEIDGVVYYDDSKGTNVGATIAALEGLGRKVVLLAGGEGKGQDFAPLKTAVIQHARAVVLFGRDAHLLAAALDGCGVPLLHAKDMNDAVLQAAQLALPGDAVLLSPACASFDMFRNYVHRAEKFVEAVHGLTKEFA